MSKQQPGRAACSGLWPAVAAVVFLACLAPGGARAASARRQVARGNAAYAAGRYQEARKAYDAALVESPENAAILFNRAVAAYRTGDIDGARNGFRDAATRTRDLALEARSAYNLGNCSYTEVERQRDSDPSKALDACKEAIRHYQRALELAPEMKQAGENIEIVRLVMKTLLDEINRRREEQQQRQQQQQQAAQKLQDLLQRQQDLRDQTTGMSTNTAAGAEQEQALKDLASRQESLRDETRQAGQDVANAATNAPGMAQAVQETGRAAAAQNAAAQHLRKQAAGDAVPQQDEAVQALERALKALQSGDGQGQQQQQQQQQAHGEQEPREPQGEQPVPAPNPKPDEQAARQQARALQLPDDARDILDKERENRERRRAGRADIRPVEKDW